MSAAGLPAALTLGGSALCPSALCPPARAASRHHRTPGGADGPAAPPAATSPAQTPLGPLDIEARWAFILDETTGATLLSKAADELMPPSSLTKMMTAYIVFSELKKGHLRLDQTLPVSEKAWRMQGSKMFVPLGQQVSVEDLVRGMLVQSGNDACIVLAEGIAGSEDQFVVLMNQEAQRLGLAQTHFQNATGWPDPDHHMSARDVGLLAMDLIRNFPDDYHFFSEKSFTYNRITQPNRNVPVVQGLADGLKTGHTEAGGFGICVSSERSGRRVIVVLNGLPSSRARVEESERLLGWAFANFDDVRLLAAHQVVQSVPVWLGARPSVGAAIDQDIVLTVPNGWRSRAKVVVDFASPVTAPVRAGQVIGTLVVSGTGFADLRAPLVAADTVARLGLAARAVAVLKSAVGGG